MLIRYLVSITKILKDTLFGLDNNGVRVEIYYYYYYSVLDTTRDQVKDL
jgi:hypothetical protein